MTTETEANESGLPPSVNSALQKMKRWHDAGQATPIYQPEKHKIIDWMLDNGLIRCVGPERLGPLGIYTGETCFRVTDKGIAACG